MRQTSPQNVPTGPVSPTQMVLVLQWDTDGCVTSTTTITTQHGQQKQRLPLRFCFELLLQFGDRTIAVARMVLCL